MTVVDSMMTRRHYDAIARAVFSSFLGANALRLRYRLVVELARVMAADDPNFCVVCFACACGLDKGDAGEIQAYLHSNEGLPM